MHRNKIADKMSSRGAVAAPKSCRSRQLRSRLMNDESDLATPRRACLVQIYPADVVDGMMLIRDEALLIGSDDCCDLVLQDPSVSPQHARIRRVESGFEIEDLSSDSGTFVADQSVQRHRLISGDTIRLGMYLFKYLSAGSVESKYHETLYSALTRDALTGAMNQRYLLETLDRSIAAARRQGVPLSVVMIDIDDFKGINDQYGHLVGDAVLREFGQRLIETCRPDDLVARYGGEEFSLLLVGTDASDALALTQQCWEAIRRDPFRSNHDPIPVTASFGVACLQPDAEETGNALLRRADERMYDAKRAGRDQVMGPVDVK
ncbi:GGDEF domain-containing protein [Rhodopirellula baltica]|nr:GGDEF domain-containing protein [Rhodopirellula baltica]